MTKKNGFSHKQLFSSHSTLNQPELLSLAAKPGCLRIKSIILSLFVKIQERKPARKKKTLKQYKQKLKETMTDTNANSGSVARPFKKFKKNHSSSIQAKRLCDGYKQQSTNIQFKTMKVKDWFSTVRFSKGQNSDGHSQS